MAEPLKRERAALDRAIFMYFLPPCLKTHRRVAPAEPFLEEIRALGLAAILRQAVSFANQGQPKTTTRGKLMFCRYCGLETGSGVGHRSQAECIQALNAEIDRAKRLMIRVKEAERAGTTGDRDGPHKERMPVQMT